jgi:hypothetical protein
VTDRKKQVANRAKGDGQARTLSNLKITTVHLAADYQIFPHDLARGDTGLLKIFTLSSNAPGKPSFEARVDDGSPGKRKDPELDFDIRGVSAAIERYFKAGRKGYIGHHTNRSPNANQRIFDVDIKTPEGTIFEGEVSFNAAFSVSISMSINSTVSADAQVVRAGCFTRLRNIFSGLRRQI